METQLSNFKNWDILSVQGELVVKYLSKIREHLDNIILKKNPHVAFDLSQTSYIDSSALTLLLNFQKRILAANGRIAIFSASDDAKAIFSIVGLDSCIVMYSTREEFEKASAQ